jgi:hypothetical protein
MVSLLIVIHSIRWLLGAALTACALVGVWMYYGVKFFLWMAAEPVKKYLLNPPKMPEEGNLLEKPSIKVYYTPIASLLRN